MCLMNACFQNLFLTPSVKVFFDKQLSCCAANFGILNSKQFVKGIYSIKYYYIYQNRVYQSFNNDRIGMT